MKQAYLSARSREMFEIGQQKFHAEEFLRTSNSQNETCIVYRTAMIGRFLVGIERENGCLPRG